MLRQAIQAGLKKVRCDTSFHLPAHACHRHLTTCCCGCSLHSITCPL